MFEHLYFGICDHVSKLDKERQPLVTALLVLFILMCFKLNLDLHWISSEFSQLGKLKQLFPCSSSQQSCYLFVCLVAIAAGVALQQGFINPYVLCCSLLGAWRSQALTPIRTIPKSTKVLVVWLQTHLTTNCIY